MKKMILFFSAMLFLVLSVSAEKKEDEKKPVYMEYHQTGHGDFIQVTTERFLSFLL